MCVFECGYCARQKLQVCCLKIMTKMKQWCIIIIMMRNFHVLLLYHNRFVEILLIHFLMINLRKFNNILFKIYLELCIIVSEYYSQSYNYLVSKIIHQLVTSCNQFYSLITSIRLPIIATLPLIIYMACSIFFFVLYLLF